MNTTRLDSAYKRDRKDGTFHDRIGGMKSLLFKRLGSKNNIQFLKENITYLMAFSFEINTHKTLNKGDFNE